ncbi:MFS general substrate transporter [Poronia punctata]|nr:MFS general substrate transporter [Poronia punctata]
MFLAMFIVALDRTIIGTATPRITEDFHSLGDIGWYGSAYQLTTAASQLLFGRVYKFYENKKIFLFTVAMFEIGSVICGTAPNSVAFIVGRSIAGLGGAGIFSGVTIIMISMVPLRKRPMFQGMFGTIFGLASVLGPLVGGALTDAASWRWCFYINLPIGAVAALCLIFFLDPWRYPHPPATLWDQFRRLDPLGTFFFVPSIVCLLISLQWGGSTYAWRNWRIIVLLGLFGVLFIAFGTVQVLAPKTATVPVRVIKRRSILAATVFMFSVAGSFLMAIYFLPLWFQVVRGATPLESGIYTLPFVLSLVVASILSGAFTQKVGYYVPAMIASPSLLAIGQGLMSTFRVDEVSSHWIGFQILAGFGLGLGMQASTLAAQAVLPMPDVPIGIAIMYFAQQLGGGIFTSVGQNLLSSYLVSHLKGIPGLSPDKITGAGADLVSSVDPEYQLAVKAVYNQAISRIFLCSMGVAIVAVVASFFMEWKNVKDTRPSARTKPPTITEDTERAESPCPVTTDDSHRRTPPSNPPGLGNIDDIERLESATTTTVGERKSATRGCEHCQHCQRTRPATATSTPSGSQTSPYPPSPLPRISPTTDRHHQTNPSHPSDPLEEVARLHALARETIAKMEELSRSLSPMVSTTLPSPAAAAYFPRDNRRQSFAPTGISPRSEPTTEELVENARRVSAQLEQEEREERARLRRARTRTRARAGTHPAPSTSTSTEQWTTKDWPQG